VGTVIGRRFHETTVAALGLCAGVSGATGQWLAFGISVAFTALAIFLGPDRVNDLIGTEDEDRTDVRKPW
jgi:hypothetical protein